MPDPRLVDGPVHPPGRCFVCGTVEGMMVDTFVDLVGDGRVYVCARICMPLFGRLLGYLPPEEAARLRVEAGLAAGRAERLQAQLDGIERLRIVSLDDLEKLGVGEVRPGGPGRIPEPV